MTFTPHNYWTLHCDWPACPVGVLDDTEFTAMAEMDHLIDMAREAEWLAGAQASGWFCPEHPTAWESDRERVGEMVGPFLLVHDDADDLSHEDGTVSIVADAVAWLVEHPARVEEPDPDPQVEPEGE